MATQSDCILPPQLKPGDCFGIAAPAGTFRQSSLEKGLAVLKKIGFIPYIPESIFQKKGYLAGDDENRSDTLNALFRNPEVKGILCVRGGYGSLRILEKLDYASIKAFPKVFMGFSDITALLYAIYRKSKIVTFHAPVATSLGEDDPETIDGFQKVLGFPKRLALFAENDFVINSGKATGKLIGGNLTTLCHLIGTPFSPKFNNHLMLMEDRGEALYRIDRMLTHMQMAGCFDGLQGVIVGTFNECGDTDKIYSLIKEIFKDKNIPILAGFRIGHGRTNYTVPLGARADMDTEKKQLTVYL
jgi:muramoyltetrapeptide carboxypeptidase